MMSPAHSAALRFPLFLVLATIVTRWPFRTHWLFNWDSGNFALGTLHYDVRLHQPQPPGYFLYVMAGRLVSFVTPDVNAAFVVVSIILSAAAAVCLYGLGRTMVSETTGRWAALLLLGSVTFWSYGGIALAYVALATFSTAVALLAYRIRFLHDDRLPLLAGVFALGGGFRPDLTLFLLPLAALAAWRQPPRRIALAMVVGGAVFGAWFGPTVWLSGGLAEYWAVFRAYGSTDVLDRYSSTSRGLSGFAVNLRDTASYTFYALYATAALLPFAAVGLLASARKLAAVGEARAFRARLAFLIVWMTPMLAFYIIVHIGDPGYAFSFLPGVLLAAAWGWEGLPLPSALDRHRTRLLGAGIAAVLMANAGIFLFHDRLLTVPGLRASDAATAGRMALARGSGPATVFVSYDSLKHLRYYVPGHTDGIWLDIFWPVDRPYGIPDAARELLLLDTGVVERSGMLPGEVIALPGGQQARRVPLPAGRGRLLVWHAPGPERPRGELRLTMP